MGLSLEQRLELESREKFIRDQATRMEHSFERGLERSELIGQIRRLESLLLRSQSPADQLRTWSLDDLARQVDALQAELRGRE